MSLLNGKYDTLRGYPNSSGLEWDFEIKKTLGVAATIPQGSIVTQEAASTGTVVNLASPPDVSSNDPIDLWVAVESNDDFSGAYVGKCHCVKIGSGVIFKTDQITLPGTYTVGLPVTCLAGVLLTYSTAADQVIGRVMVDNSLVDGTITVSC